MLAWLASNMVNIALAALVLAVAGLAIHGMIRAQRAGKSSCGCGCADCGACRKCAGAEDCAK